MIYQFLVMPNHTLTNPRRRGRERRGVGEEYKVKGGVGREKREGANGKEEGP